MDIIRDICLFIVGFIVGKLHHKIIEFFLKSILCKNSGEIMSALFKGILCSCMKLIVDNPQLPPGKDLEFYNNFSKEKQHKGNTVISTHENFDQFDNVSDSGLGSEVSSSESKSHSEHISLQSGLGTISSNNNFKVSSNSNSVFTSNCAESILSKSYVSSKSPVLDSEKNNGLSQSLPNSSFPLPHSLCESEISFLEEDSLIPMAKIVDSGHNRHFHLSRNDIFEEANEDRTSSGLTKTLLEAISELNDDARGILELVKNAFNGTVAEKDHNIKHFHPKFTNDFEELRKSSRKFTREGSGISEKFTCMPTVQENKKLIQEVKQALSLCSKYIQERGLNLVSKISVPQTLPKFNGLSLPTLHDHLENIHEFCIYGGIPYHSRGKVLLDSLTGAAQNFVSFQISDLSPSFEFVKHILMAGFGRPDAIDSLLINLHKRIGQIQPDANYFLVKEHWQIVQTMNRHIGRWSHGQGLAETPVTSQYLRTLESIFHPNYLKEIYGKKDWVQKSNIEKFQLLYSELEKIHIWVQRTWVLNNQM